MYIHQTWMSTSLVCTQGGCGVNDLWTHTFAYSSSFIPPLLCISVLITPGLKKTGIDNALIQKRSVLLT